MHKTDIPLDFKQPYNKEGAHFPSTLLFHLMCSCKPKQTDMSVFLQLNGCTLDQQKTTKFF